MSSTPFNIFLKLLTNSERVRRGDIFPGLILKIICLYKIKEHRRQNTQAKTKNPKSEPQKSDEQNQRDVYAGKNVQIFQPTEK